MNEPAVTRLGNILGVWAHPDDETFMIGGLMAIAAENGQVVHCVTATKGEAGVQDGTKWPAETLAATRASEVSRAMHILGTDDPIFFDYADGGCAEVPAQEAVTKIANIIDAVKPDTVVTFAPDGLTGHADHKAVSGWAARAVRQAKHPTRLYYAVHTQESYDAFWHVVHDKFNIYFASQSPKFVLQKDCTVLLQLEPWVAAKKTAALKAMPSQYEAMFQFLGDNGVQAAVGTEALIEAP